MTTIFLGLSLRLAAEEIEITNSELLEKIEVLEVELEKVKIEATDSSPIATGETLEWGTGLSLGVKLSSETDGAFEIMYNFPINGLKTKEKYNSKDQGRKLGIGLVYGFRSFNDLFFDYHVEETLFTQKVGLKLSSSSPVMMNYISASFYIIPFVQFLYEGDNENYSAIDFGIDIGGEINIWMNNRGAMYFGFMCDPSILSIYGDRDLQNPLAYKMTFGSKIFF